MSAAALIVSLASFVLLVSLLTALLNLRRQLVECTTSLRLLTSLPEKNQNEILTRLEVQKQASNVLANQIGNLRESVNLLQASSQDRATRDQTFERLTQLLQESQTALVTFQENSRAHVEDLLNRLASHNWQEYRVLSGQDVPRTNSGAGYPQTPDAMWVENNLGYTVVEVDPDDIPHEDLVESLREDFGSVPT